MDRSMTTGRRIALTVAAAIVFGLDTWVAEQPGWPASGVHQVLAIPLSLAAWTLVFVAPLIVAHWWVVGAVAGPGLALVAMQASGVLVQLDDGTGRALNYRTILWLVVLGLILLLMVGVRHMVDLARSSWRDRHPAASPRRGP